MVCGVPSGETPHDEADEPGSCPATASDDVLLDARSLADLRDYRLQLNRMGAEERAARLFHLMMECPRTGDSVQLQLCGRKMSQQEFIDVLGLSNQLYYRVLKHIKSGSQEPPTDGRKDRFGDLAPAREHADAWMNWAWHSMAEPLAEALVKDFDDEVDAKFPGLVSGREQDLLLTPLASAKEWVLGPAASMAATKSLVHQRWMEQMTMTEFYDLYVSTCDGQPCSLSSFQRAWTCGRWDRKLKFRALGTHSACAECTRLREWAQKSLSEEDKAKVADARERHRFRILLDRATNTRLNEISARAMGHDELGPVTADLDVGGGAHHRRDGSGEVQGPAVGSGWAEQGHGGVMETPDACPWGHPLRVPGAVLPPGHDCTKGRQHAGHCNGKKPPAGL